MSNWLSAGPAVSLISAATSAPTSGQILRCNAARKAFEARLTGTGAVTATVAVYGSVTEPSDYTDMVRLATIDLNGTNKAVDGVAIDAPWIWLLGRLESISGTGASLDLKAAY